MNKTNAMRQLDRAKISYKQFEYIVDENDLSGEHVAAQIGVPQNKVFKTLVAKGERKGYTVFCIPVNKELDLKKCAKATGDKKVELVAVKQLLGLTGYIRGGCSPIGMKKKFPTYFDISAEREKEITVSAGVRGCQLMIDCNDLLEFTQASLADITVS